MRTVQILSVLFASALLLSAVGGCRSMTGRSAGRYVDDKGIAASVKTKLTADHASNLTRIGVNVVDGTVYLTGTVDTPEQKARAAEVANRVNGVKSVVNEIQVAESKTTR
jgi:hyperosmotically inducible periplasmic protein